MKRKQKSFRAMPFLSVVLWFAIPTAQAQVIPASGSDCDNPVAYTGTFNGNLTVSAGQNCSFNGGGVTGHVQQNGGTLTLMNSQVTGNVQITGASVFSIGPGTIIGGNLQIQRVSVPAGSTGAAAPAPGGGCTAPPAPDGGAPAPPAAPAVAPATGNGAAPPAPAGGCGGAAPYQICLTIVQGDLQFQNNDVAPLIGGACGGKQPACKAGQTCPGAGNTIRGNMQVKNNSADTDIEGNTVSGNVQVSNNVEATTVSGNTVTGNIEVSNNSGGDTVTGNTVNGNLQDMNNSGPVLSYVENNTVTQNLQCRNNFGGTTNVNNTAGGNLQCY